ncbi:MAG: 30S ribosomal protein S20, small subunit ribosomal protein S20 [Candidatus Peregrinibacteria bacterium GW2011_GWF2_33_10]|nr:MAG: 30S ribosomal protein S20, small subunit ribosomal protein S20 [Candidatus Peregrinibacteria bacterium GW2011_GWF2_33_10]OGJ44241.1 MAG: 30S ribosomal protein S20 [Candidatus Peregrinibacteria bacterium RIFOXYA12_FULL_33_12]OGJ44899.1 MAG: 30S ribosomal protein S20 [Candidatus Peregrinibacteria bacterium RIFOXYA2_FULL_33_21]OGJ50658.1 MAG: 30S ribosomal protein S20 [Candidatus Peregrinibacteria bacterium RIFOXYB2_FULL_33_20]
MPIIKSAIKKVRQAEKHQKRNYEVRRKLKASIRSVIDAVKEKKTEEAQKSLQTAYKVIDTAAKKRIIHKKNADRKKSRIAKLVNSTQVKK